MTSLTLRLTAIMATTLSLSLTACGTKENEAATADSTATVSGKDTAATPPAEVKTYTFHGTPTMIDKASGVIRVNHEKIPDFMEAMEMDFDVADPAIFDKVIIGKNTHFTMRVSGTEMLITKVEDEHAPGTEHDSTHGHGH